MLKKLDIHASVLIIKLTVDTETNVTQTKTLALVLYLFCSVFKDRNGLFYQTFPGIIENQLQRLIS